MSSQPQFADGQLYADLFPGNIIPLAVSILPLWTCCNTFPLRRTAATQLVTTPVQPVRADQFTVKIDHRTQTTGRT